MVNLSRIESSQKCDCTDLSDIISAHVGGCCTFRWMLCISADATFGAFSIKTAVSVPCPFPVRASDPNNSILSEAIFSRGNFSIQLNKNCLAAYIGPTVCELEGPIPILKRSNTILVTTLESSPLRKSWVKAHLVR